MKAEAFAEVEDVMSARVAWRDVEKMRPEGGAEDGEVEDGRMWQTMSSMIYPATPC